MTKRLLAALTVFALLGSSGAVACVVKPSIEQHIQWAARNDTVVLAEVRQADYSESRYKERPWKGIVVVKRVLKGRADSEVFAIGRSGNTAMCDDGIPTPRAGDLWILYIDSSRRPDLEPVLGYPLNLAREADSQIEALLASDGTK